jgi:hypothetical protein
LNQVQGSGGFLLCFPQGLQETVAFAPRIPIKMHEKPLFAPLYA